ncbi:phage tail protein [Lachnospiraceae bacterium OttesenSCG-928-D06]|nr:phage tail protein [Lachnospiraceae bacterium OttesenSCG-928-D06]
MPIPVKRIDSYEELEFISDNDIILIVSNNTTYNVSGKSLITYIKSHPELIGNTNNKGFLQLIDSTSSTSKTNAATPNSVKVTYDKVKSVENTILANKSIWDDKYTKNEVDNKFSTLESSIDWKEAVLTYNDIKSTYPNPQDGWTVNVKDTDYTYRYSGTEWVAISANSIPKATTTVDGLLSKEDKVLYDDTNSKKHTHSNKSVLDTITSTQIAKWDKSETNIQSDWNSTDLSSDDYIKNKPTKVSQFENDLGFLTEAEKGTDFFIIGTQTSTTASWTGIASNIDRLYDGLTIRFWLPYTSASNVTLNLTLKDGNSTGAINCYYGGTTRLGTHYIAGNIVTLTYIVNKSISGTNYTGWWADANYDSNNYDRFRYQQSIKCGTTAIATGNIIVGNNGLYQHLKLGKPFDVTYPILYAASAISANGTGTNNYLIYYFTITTTQALALTAYKPVYIKGTLSGTIFTPISTVPLTQAVPTTADGYQYMLLGTAYNTTAMYMLPEHQIYEYKDGIFQLYGGSGGEGTDTKNTAGATDSSVKLFIIGAPSQTNNPQTYSHNTVFIGTDGCLYSNNIQVVTLTDVQNLTNKTYNGYTLNAACAKTVTDSSSASALSTGTGLVTERDIYYGLPKINNAKNYTSNSNFYAPISSGTSGHFLKSTGGVPSFSSLTKTEVTTALGFAPRRFVNSTSEPTGLSINDEWLMPY